MKKFVKTSDEQTANLLRDAGLHELAKEGNKWVFVNEQNKITFSLEDKKLSFTDILTF
jgi:hypothetical protein